jgi:hypothetical protein
VIRRLRAWLFERRERKATEFLRDPAAVEEAKRRAVEALPELEHDPATCDICRLQRERRR